MVFISSSTTKWITTMHSSNWPRVTIINWPWIAAVFEWIILQSTVSKFAFIYNLDCRWPNISFHFPAALAERDEFMALVGELSYPLNQRVLRLKELPAQCTAHDIRSYFQGSLFFLRPFYEWNLTLFDLVWFFFFGVLGLTVTDVHLIHNKAYKFIGEAFVKFGEVDDIELALRSVSKNNNKIQNKQFKVFRSSDKQFRTYCDTSTIKKLAMARKDQRTNRLESLSEIHQLWECTVTFCKLLCLNTLLNHSQSLFFGWAIVRPTSIEVWTIACDARAKYPMDRHKEGNCWSVCGYQNFEWRSRCPFHSWTSQSSQWCIHSIGIERRLRIGGKSQTTTASTIHS